MNRLPNNLTQWLEAIDSSHPTEIDLGLDRIRPVADALGVTAPWPMPVISVAGTNGKGSTVALIRAVAEAHGLRVGSYTSPHFIRYNERVGLAQGDASDQQLCDAFAAVECARAQCGVTLTYFEYGTLAALWLFRLEALDLLVLEVGLGGRLDAVNLIDADVAVVTTVALDHEAWLGSDRESIGREKAGIARPGRTLVYGETSLPGSISDHCQAQSIRLLRWGREFGPEGQAGDWCWSGIDADGVQRQLTGLPPVTLPFANASTALQALLCAGIELHTQAVARGLAAARLTGRMQQIAFQGRQLILDVAHNPHAAAHLAQHLEATAGTTWCVVGMLADKDARATLAPLVPLVDHWCLANLHIDRGAGWETLRRALGDRPSAGFGSVGEALDSVFQKSRRGDQVLVMGSFYTVAEALLYLEESGDGPA